MHGCQVNNTYEVKWKTKKIGRRASTYHQMVQRAALVASHPCLIYVLPSTIYKGWHSSSMSKPVSSSNSWIGTTIMAQVRNIVGALFIVTKISRHAGRHILGDIKCTSWRFFCQPSHNILTFCDTLEKSSHIVIFYDAIVVIYYIVNASHYVHVVTDGTLEGFFGGAFVTLLYLSGSSCIVVTHLVTRTFCLV